MEAWRRSAPPQEGGGTQGLRHGSAVAPCSPAGWGCRSRWDVQRAGNINLYKFNWSFVGSICRSSKCCFGYYLTTTTYVSVLLSQLNGPVLGPEGTTGMYSSSKMAAGHYQRAVQQFSSSLQGGGHGTWIRKPPKSSHFGVGVWKTECQRLNISIYFVLGKYLNNICHLLKSLLWTDNVVNQSAAGKIKTS